jgi:hypothetical protein
MFEGKETAGYRVLERMELGRVLDSGYPRLDVMADVIELICAMEMS